MDKNTLSEYGWVIIVIVVAAILLALTSPLGSYITNGVTNIAEQNNKQQANLKNDVPSVSISVIKH